MDFIGILISFVEMFGYHIIHNVALKGAYGDTSLYKREVRLYDELAAKDKESILMVLAHETGHVFHLEYDFLGTFKRSKISWELTADYFCLEVLKMAGEEPSSFIDSHMVNAYINCSTSERAWASKTSKRGIKEFKKFIKNSYTNTAGRGGI